MKRIEEEDLTHILRHTKSLWPQVSGKTFFLTGGTGFFGKWLTESFLYINEQLKRNATLIILSRDPEQHLRKFPFLANRKDVHFIKGDITNFNFPSLKIDYIIHAATEANADLNQNQPLAMLDTITLGTRRVLDLARENAVESFLLTSSGAIYGKQPADVTHVKESNGFFIDINNPNSAYAEGKRLAELYCSTYFKYYTLPVKIARCFAFVGPYLPLDQHFAIGNFILNAIRNENICIKGDGSPFRSYLYASDLAIWLWTILFSGENNQCYNVGSEKEIDIESLAGIIRKLCYNKIDAQILTERKKDAVIERYVPSTQKAQKQLNLSETINLEDAISKTINFYHY